MDGQYPADLNKKSETPDTQAPSPSFAPNHPPEDEDLYLPPSQRPKPKWRKIAGTSIKIFVAVLLVAAIAGAVYWKFFHNKKPAPVATSQASTQTTPKSDIYTNKTKSVSSTNVGLTLTYPESWDVSDQTDKLTIASPVTSFADASNQRINGKIVLTVQPKGSELPAFAKSGVISALDSQKIKYTKPTSIQRGETYMSFLQYTQALTKGQLDGVYVTGDFGYQANQYVPKTDIAKLDPLITVTFLKCADDTCADSAASSIQSDMWASNAEFQKTITAMLKSIQVNN